MVSLDEIKKRRLQLDLNQAELAKLAGVSQSLVAKLESGKLDPSFSNAMKLFDALEREEKKSERVAREILNDRVCIVGQGDRVAAAIQLMKSNGISQIPVLNNGVIVGSISEKIILEKMMEFNMNISDFSNLKISEVMGNSFPTVDEDCPLSILSSLLRRNEAVLVLRRADVIGIVSKADLFRV